MPRRRARREPRPRQLDCSVCPNLRCTEWHVLDQEQTARLNAAKATMFYGAGDVVFYQGNPCTGLYCVESGVVGVRMTDEGGNSVLLRLLRGGMILGAEDYFGGSTHAASAEVLAPSTVCFIETAMVRALVGDNTDLGLRFLEQVARRLEGSEASLLHNLTHTVRARLAHLLVVLQEHYGSPGHNGTVALELPLNRQGLAEMLGTRPETIARALHALEEDGLVHHHGRRLEITNLDALTDEADWS